MTQALIDDGHRAIGLCNVGDQPAAPDRRRSSSVEPERVELEHVGLNHLTWERAVRVDGVDRLPELLDEHAEVLAEEFRHAGRHAPDDRARSRPTTCATTT